MKFENTHRQSNKEVFFSLENIFTSNEAQPIKNASSLFLFSVHSELETGLLPQLAASYDKHSLETEIRVSPSGVILNSERHTFRLNTNIK